MTEFDKAVDALYKSLKGLQRPSHKYYKREPDGKGGYRYYYTKSEYEKRTKR